MSVSKNSKTKSISGEIPPWARPTAQQQPQTSAAPAPARVAKSKTYDVCISGLSSLSEAIGVAVRFQNSGRPGRVQISFKTRG